VGLPSPGAALFVIATILALGTPGHGPGVLLPVGVSVVPAALMVSSIRFRSFRGVLSPQTPQARATTTVLALLLLVGLVLAPATTGLVVACAYLLTAPLGVLTAPLRERVFGAQAVAPPRHRMQSVFLPATGEDA
jgi:CDP-diacylglycerol--serine O-phosphatidyltransferase